MVSYLEIPVGGEAQAVAGGAEVLRHGRDEPYGPRVPRHLPHLHRTHNMRPVNKRQCHHTSRLTARTRTYPRGVVGARRQRPQVGEALQDGAQRRTVRHHFAVIPRVTAERHELNKPREIGKKSIAYKGDHTGQYQRLKIRYLVGVN